MSIHVLNDKPYTTPYQQCFLPIECVALMKTDRTLLKYFLLYTALVCAWLLGSFYWQANRAIHTDHNALALFINLVSLAVFSAVFWFLALILYNKHQAKLEAGAKTQLKRLKLALDAAQEALWDWSLNDDEEIFFSAAYCAKLGYTQAEFGNNQSAWQKHLIPEERERVYRNVMNFIAEGDGDYDSTYRMQHKDGSQRWIRSRGRLIKNAKGIPVRLIGIAQDITEQRGAEERLKQAHAVFESTNEGVLITDSDNTIIHINPAFSRITGYSPEEVIGQTPRMFKSGRHTPEFYQNLWKTLETTDEWRGEIWNRRKNGEILPQYQTIRLIRDENGFISHNVAVFSDIAVLHNSPAQLSYHAYYDPLTGLGNRTHLQERLKTLLHTSAQQQQSGAVLLIDLDNFKHINDKLGHHLGDQLLQAVAQRISKVVRNKCSLARIGRDQFVAVCDCLESTEQATALAEQTLAHMHEPFHLDNKVIKVSLCVAVEQLPNSTNNPEALMHSLENTLKRAKAQGPGSFALAQDHTAQL